MTNDTLLKTKWQREQLFLANLKKEKPTLFNRHINDPQDLMASIGVSTLSPELPKGYIHYTPADFIVEEIWKDSITEADLITKNEKLTTNNSDSTAVFCDLVKVNTTTYDALEQIAEALDIPVTKIHHAGVKDTNAVSAQKLSITGATKADLKKIKNEKFILKNIYEGKGAVSPDELVGHRYTVVVRTGQKIIEGRLNKRIEDIAKDGLVNFYGTQRFGSPRFISHELGKYILQGNFKRAIKTFIYNSTPNEAPAVTMIRRKAKVKYGDWSEARRLFTNFPYMLRYELEVLDYLIENPIHFAGALKVIQDQARMWVYAYGSYLTNTVLSMLAKSDRPMPEMLPTIIHPDPSKIAIYDPILKRDEIIDHARALQFLGIYQKESFVPTRVYPTFNLAPVVTDNAVTMSFNLPKGAYANVLIAQLFKSYAGWPVPEWVKNTNHDSKSTLGLGEISKLSSSFADLHKPIDFKA